MLASVRVDVTIFLVRHGETDWHREGRVVGDGDAGLNADGINQAHAVMTALEGLEIIEVVSSPALRAMQTAEVLAGPGTLEIARDPRLADFHIGPWAGMKFDALAVDPDYKRFAADPLAERLPGGELLTAIRDRAIGSLHQTLADNGAGENVVVVTHANIIRIILAHYLGASLASFHRIRISPGSLTLLRFSATEEIPRVLAVNVVPGAGVLPHLK
jgi:broad specificity phosphatase PhoE